jgi:hypothetical protein
MAAALRLVGYQKKKGQTSLTNVLTTTIRKPERRMTHRVQKRVTTLSIKQTRNHPLHTHTHTHTIPPLHSLLPNQNFLLFVKKYKFPAERLKSKRKNLLLLQKPWGRLNKFFGAGKSAVM